MASIYISVIVHLIIIGKALCMNLHDLNTLNDCGIKLEAIGCYADMVNDRLLTEKLIDEMHLENHHFNFENHTFLPGFIFRCADNAYNRGFKVIGIQNYAECWSGPTAHLTYKKYGESNQCVDQKYATLENPKNCSVGAGIQSTNFIYRIAPTVCSQYYEPLGCYKDDLLAPRPLPDFIQTERDYKDTERWNNVLIDWVNWSTYSPEMICRCAKKAKSEGKDFFGIQFWGECWAGNEETSNYQRIGKSDNCYGTDLKKCKCDSYHCVGSAFSNYVYRLKDEPFPPLIVD